MFEKNLYKVLQVDPEADQDVITAAYRVLADRLHPERDTTGVAEYRMAELNRAYTVLGNPSDRRAYDAQLAADALVAMGPGPEPGNGNGFGVGHSIAEDGASPFGSTLSDRIRARSADPQDLAQVRLDFGRYAGWTLGDILRQDADYLRWLSRHSSGIRYRGAILRLLAAVDGRPRMPVNTRS